MTAPTVAGIVLAGGASRRFGADKLVATVDGRPLLELAVAAVAEVATSGAVVVAGRPAPADPASVAAAQFVPDRMPGAGPLAGLADALETVTAELAIVVAGDMPRLRPVVLRLLLEALGLDAAVVVATLSPPAPGAARQVLPMSLRVEAGRAAARAALDRGDRSLVGFIDSVPNRIVAASTWLPLDPDAGSVVDVDSRDDLARLPGRAIDR